jgi:four helix bundle protein
VTPWSQFLPSELRLGVAGSAYFPCEFANHGLNFEGHWIAAYSCMKEASDKRKRTLALQDRALKFTNAVNVSCPRYFSNKPSAKAWDQLVRAADGTSNNLIEADAASSDKDFLAKMGIALREAKESRAELAKIRMGRLDNHHVTAQHGLESEADQLAGSTRRSS